LAEVFTKSALSYVERAAEYNTACGNTSRTGSLVFLSSRHLCFCAHAEMPCHLETNGQGIVMSKSSKPIRSKREETLDQHIGRRLRLYRNVKGISQKKLGQSVGITFQQIQKYEKATNRIGSGRLLLLARFLGVPITYFYEGLPEYPLTGPDLSRFKNQKIIGALLRLEGTPSYPHLCKLIKELAKSLE
jgi:transcriptional regulator with XRE-family HTH domain